MFNIAATHRSNLKRISLAILLAQLVACGGGGGSSSSSSISSGSGALSSDNGSVSGGDQVNVSLQGSVGDGPIINADIFFFDRSGDLLAVENSDSFANFSKNFTAPSSAFPITIEAQNGTDLVTNATPDFTLRSVSLNQSQDTTNLNPFSTMIVEVAERMQGGITAANIAAASTIVLREMNFGLNPAKVADPISESIDTSNVGTMVKSSEAFGEMIRRTRDGMISIGQTVDGDDIIDRLAEDLVDGTLDGQGGNSVDPRTSAVAAVNAAQVLVESLSNSLRVNGALATAAMDTAISTVLPGSPSSSMTLNVTINNEMITHTAAMLDAVMAFDDSAAITSLANDVDSITPNSSASTVASFIPASDATVLNSAVNNIVTATSNDVVAVNARTVADSAPPPAPGNNAPVIGGNPASTVAEDSSYSFTPSASDVDGDSLSFAISNKPSWASFNSSTGRLNGTPRNGDVGSYSNIRITVSDGADTDVLGPFSITVTNTNDAPVISGSPATSVTAGNSYSFTPSASDVDGDSLSFSISNKPAWASFNTSTGRLSGTPDNGDAGTFSNIVISVNDGTTSVSLSSFSVNVSAVVVSTGEATVSWVAPSTREDGSPLSLSEISGYRIYYGTSAGNYTQSVQVNNSAATEHTISGLTPATYHFVVTTLDVDGMESDYSTSGSKTIN